MAPASASIKKRAQPVDQNAAIPESFIAQFIDHPGAFIVPNAEARNAAMDVVQRTYDAANFTDKFGIFDTWADVASSGFDTDSQLWELINIRNDPVFKHTASVMRELTQLVDSVELGSDDEDEGAKDEIDENDTDEDIETEDEEEDEEEDDVKGMIDNDTEVSEGETGDEDEVDKSQDEESEEEKDIADEPPKKGSVVDDDFFSLADMEAFADEAEEEDMRDRAILAGDYPKPAPGDYNSGEESSETDEDDIDMFQNVDSDDGNSDMMDEDDDVDDEDGLRAEEMKFSDFFQPPTNSKRAAIKAAQKKHSKRVKFDPNMSESDSEGDEEDEAPIGRSNLFDDDDDDENNDSPGAQDNKSEFEKRQEKLQGLISKLEDEAVEKKDWTMIGEVTSTARPKDSLIGEHLEFDHVQKPVPLATQEATQTLEDMIRQRILNEQWDDVKRKKDIQAHPFKPSEFIELNDKASKKSLAEVYEAEYMAQKAGEDYVHEKDAKVEEAHKVVDNMFRDLFAQLDALSHFQFAPRAARPDVEIRTSAPALQMEEKLPVHMSHAEQLAPEELYEKNQGRDGRTGDLKGKSEMTREDNKLRRSRLKHAQKKKNDAIAEQKGISKTAEAAAKKNKDAKTAVAGKTQAKK
ncbi:U3 snoRNP protein [Coemansia sp. Benny D115]|nr:U3 snoRNP protein [Coemansia sp. Benny D115]